MSEGGVGGGTSMVLPEFDGWFDLRKRDEGVGPISMQILT